MKSATNYSTRYSLPVASGETVSLECASPYVKTADFMCVDGTFTAPVCRVEIEIASGDCGTLDGCVTSPNYPEEYGGSEQCSFTIKGPAMVTAEAFDASADDDYPDYLTFGSVRYSQTTGPSNVFAAAGATVEWAPNSSPRRRYSSYSPSGWKICAGGLPSCEQSDAPTAPFKGTVGAATYPVAASATVGLECESPYVKSGDFMCEGGPFSKEGCSLFAITSGDCKHIVYEAPRYVVIESGTCGDDYVIQDQTTCDEAATALGLSDTTSSTSSSTYNKPKGCAWYYSSLYIYEGTSDCSSSYPCICKNSASSPATACVASPNYPLQYSPDSACSITIAAPSFVNAMVFDTHTSASGRDFVKLGTAEYEGTTGPSNQIAAAGTNLIWVADDDSNVGNGWVICAEEAILLPCVAGSEPSAPAEGTVGTYPRSRGRAQGCHSPGTEQNHRILQCRGF